MDKLDYQFKDDSPVSTRSRIQDILKKYNISVNEKIGSSGVSNCFSTRVTIDHTPMGSNGKGVNLDLARASGYAELMERLQTGSMRFGAFRNFRHSDTYYLNRDEVEKKCAPFFSEVQKNAITRSGEVLTVENLIDAAFELADADTIPVIPFYDAMSGKRVLIPFSLITNLYSTNGMAAGNSMEEALVQGFSEIVERRSLLTILAGKAIPTTIPENYIRQFSTAYETICDIRSHGYDVYIKDCSLGCPIPVLAAVVIDRNSHSYHVHFGAHPVFELALERCLTEMFQGRNIEKVTSIETFYKGKPGIPRSNSDIEHSLGTGNATHSLEFFVGEPTYEFKPYENLAGKTNTELLGRILDYLKQSGYRMLVRDYSHLGFPTFRIIVPGLNEVYFDNLTPKQKFLRKPAIARRVIQNPSNCEFDDLLLASTFWKDAIFVRKMPVNMTMLAGIPISEDPQINAYYGYIHMAFLEWQLHNYHGAVQFAEAAQKFDSDEKTGSYLNYLIQVCSNAHSFNELPSYVEKLSMFYPMELAEQLKRVFENGLNPFADLIIPCDPDKCTECRMKKECNAPYVRCVAETLQNAMDVFDNEEAFRKIEEIFLKLSNEM